MVKRVSLRTRGQGGVDATRGGIAQLVERLNGIQEVAGSTPTISTKRPLESGLFSVKGELYY